LGKWIAEVKPDFFYALLSTRHSILFAIDLIKKYDVPLIIHIMDDWPATIGNDTVFSKYWNKKINGELNTLLQLSHKRLAISKLMAEEYKKRFGGDWLYFHNPVDVSLWNKPKESTKQNKSRTILYSGRLSQGISGTLKLISECVDEINDIDKLDVKFRIQSSGKPDWIDNYNNTTFNFYIPYEELPELYAQVDVLLLPYEFEGKGFDFIRLSMPTKVTEYMASATPILIVAPKSTAVVEYANREGWAYVIDNNNKELIRKGIIELFNNEEIRMCISNNALRCVLNYHEINKVQFEFSQIFN
jgi:glycosyltransferase involved in cell wall biosynthesis